MNRLEHTKVLRIVQDEIINAEKSKKYFKIKKKIFPDQIEIIEVDDNHRIENFESLLTLI